MTISTATPRNRYIMRDQVPAKIRAIMDESALEGARRGAQWEHAEDRPMLSRPGWIAVTLLLIAVNLMAVLPPAA